MEESSTAEGISILSLHVKSQSNSQKFFFKNNFGFNPYIEKKFNR